MTDAEPEAGRDEEGRDQSGRAESGRAEAERAEAVREKAARAERAAYHVEADRKRRERESAKAQVLVDEFVRDAKAAGLTTTELTARPWSGRSRYRTGLQGWYLRTDLSIGVDVDGGYHSLVVPPQRWGRLRGVTLTPTPPPLQVGEGARDGESIALAALLELRLDAGNTFT